MDFCCLARGYRGSAITDVRTVAEIRRANDCFVNQRVGAILLLLKSIPQKIHENFYHLWQSAAD